MAHPPLNRRVASLFLLCLVLPMVTGSPTPIYEALKPRNTTGETLSGCETENSSDFYGLGVRLGLYLTWFTAWIANTSMPEEIAGALDQNTIFLFALLLSMVRCTLTRTLWKLDGVVLMHMCGGTIFSVISIWGYRTCVYQLDGPRAISNFGGFGTHMRLLVCVGVSAFGLFYWKYGVMGDLYTPDDPDCADVKTFMFAKVRAAGGIRIYYQVICIMCLIYFGAMLIVSSLAGVKRISNMQFLMKEKLFKTTSRLRYATGLNQKELRYMFYFLRVANLVWMIFSILLVEFTLNFNNVRGVLGQEGHVFFPSQLIPAVIGIFTFIRILYFRYSRWRSPADVKPSLERDPTLPQSPATKPHGLGVFKIFSPEINVGAQGAPQQHTKRNKDDTAVDPLLDGQSQCLRYLVAWLPWLALYPWWHKGQNEHGVQSHSHNNKMRSSSNTTTLNGSPTSSPMTQNTGRNGLFGNSNRDFENRFSSRIG